MKLRSAFFDSTEASMISPACTAAFSFRTVFEPSAAERVDGVDLVDDELDGQLLRADLPEYRVYCGDLLDELLLGGRPVDHMEDEIGDEGLLERRGEALDELMRQAANEADSVGDQVAPPLVLEAARRRIDGLEQPVADRDARVGERVEQCRLAGVRIAGERNGGCLGAPPLFPPDIALAAELAQPVAKHRDAAACQAAVGLELRLAGAAGADACA